MCIRDSQQLQYAQEAALGSEAALRLDAQIMQRIFSTRSALTAGRLDQVEEQTADLKSLVLRRDYTYSDTTDLDARIQEVQTQLKTLRAQKVTVDSEGNRTTEDITGVYCVMGAEARFKPVQVLYTGEDFVLVESTVPVSTSTTASVESTRLRAGDEVIISAYDLYDGKVIT